MADVRLLIDDDGAIPPPSLSGPEFLRHRSHYLLTQAVGIVGVDPLLGPLHTDPFPL
jgi:hypothetical protein